MPPEAMNFKVAGAEGTWTTWAKATLAASAVVWKVCRTLVSGTWTSWFSR